MAPFPKELIDSLEIPEKMRNLPYEKLYEYVNRVHLIYLLYNINGVGAYQFPNMKEHYYPLVEFGLASESEGCPIEPENPSERWLVYKPTRLGKKLGRILEKFDSMGIVIMIDLKNRKKK